MQSYIQYWTLGWTRQGYFTAIPILARYVNQPHEKPDLRIETPRQAAASRNCILFFPNRKLLKLNNFGDCYLPAPIEHQPKWYVHGYIVKASDLIEVNRALQYLKELYKQNNLKL